MYLFANSYMTQHTQHFPAVYLVELMDPYTGELQEADVCAKLELAVEKAHVHLKEYKDSPVEVDVSFDDDDLVEGLGFFNEDKEMLACITVYHLDRDTGTAQVAGIAEACRGDKTAMQRQLNRIFRNQ